MQIRLVPMPRSKAELPVRWQDPSSFALWPNNPFTWPLTDAQVKAFWRLCRQDGEQLLLAFCGARPVGQIWARRCSNGNVHLGLILIAPHARGKGMGEAMMRAAAARFSPATVTVDVYETNLPAKRCYQKAGFRLCAAQLQAGIVRMEREWRKKNAEV